MATVGSLDPLSSVLAALQREQILADVIPSSFSPTTLFSVVYPNGKEVLLGNEFLVEETGEEPEVTLAPLNIPLEQADSTEGEVSYTLAMVDPDAPTRENPVYRSFRHWLVTGLKSPQSNPLSNIGSELRALKTKPDTTPYRPPGPRPNSGLHRYIFLLFQEPVGREDGFTVPTGAPEYGAALEERRSWNAIEFGKKYGLKLVGANFLVMQSPSE